MYFVIMFIFVGFRVDATNNNWKLYKDGKQIILDNQIQITDNKIYLPVKALFEKLDNKVTFNDNSFVVENDDLTRKFDISEDKSQIYNKYFDYYYSSIYIDNNLYAEFDFFRDNLLAKLSYDEFERKVYVDTQCTRLVTALNKFVYNENMFIINANSKFEMQGKNKFKFLRNVKNKSFYDIVWNDEEKKYDQTLLSKSTGELKSNNESLKIDVEYFNRGYDGCKFIFDNKTSYCNSQSIYYDQSELLKLFPECTNSMFLDINAYNDEIIKFIEADSIDIEIKELSNDKCSYKFKIEDFKAFNREFGGFDFKDYNMQNVKFKNEITYEIDKENNLTAIKLHSSIKDTAKESYLKSILIDFDYNIKPLKDSTEFIKQLSDLEEEVYKELYPDIDARKVVVFKDKVFEKVVRDEIGKPCGDIHAFELLNIDWLEYDGEGKEKISNIDGIQYIHNLRILNLDNNNISDISYLSNMEKLEGLYINNNQISDISNLNTNKKLSHIYLEGNKITKIPSFNNLTEVYSLSLDNNQITDISKLYTMPNLEFLYLNSNKISDLKPLQAFNNSKLEEIELAKNQIVDASPLKGLPNLRKANLAQNKISDLQCFDGMGLCTLDLSINNISDLSKLKNMKNLEYLNLQYNNITDITPLKDFKLVWLHLDNNKLKKIDVLPCKQLRYLTLSNNQIEKIDTNVFDCNNNIELLDIRNNKIKNIDFVSKINALNQIEVRGNPIDAESLKKYKNLILHITED